MEDTRTLYCIVGPSGSGKSTLEKNVKNELPWLKSVESYTTRPPRYENEPGHVFITKEEFDTLKLVAYTMFNGYEYGVTEELLDKADLYVVDLEGIKVLKERYQRPTIAIGLTVDEDTCRKRMSSRADSIEAVNARIENDKKMFEGYENYCDILIDANGDENSVLAQFIDKVAEFEMRM